MNEQTPVDETSKPIRVKGAVGRDEHDQLIEVEFDVPADHPMAQLIRPDLGHVVQDETSAQTNEIINRPKLMPGRLRMRRSGRGPAGQATTARIEGKQVAVPACPHLELVRRQVPHPRYGDRVPYFETYTRRPGAHECLTVR